MDAGRKTRAAVRAVKSRDIVAESLEEISDDLGTQRAGAFIAGDGDPEAGTLVGTAMMWPPLAVTLGGQAYQFTLVGMNGGALQFALSAVDGAAVFAGGAGTIDEAGITLSGILYALRHFAAAADGTSRRFGAMEMYYPAAQSVPALRLAFSNDPTDNLVADGGFETLPSGWQLAHAGTWGGSDVVEIAAAGAYAGAKCGHIGLVNPAGQNQAKSATITSGSFTVVAGNKYELGLKYKSGPNASLRPGIMQRVSVVWRNGSGGVISSTDLDLPAKTAWTDKTLALTAPANAASALVQVVMGHDQEGGLLVSSGDLWVDEMRLLEKSVDFWLAFTPDLVYSHGLWPQVAGWMADQMSGATVARTIHASQECSAVWWQSTPANGDERLINLVLEKGTWTLVLIGETASTCCKSDVYLDGVLQGSTLDWYSSTVAYNVEKSVTVAVLTSGQHALKLKVNGKNASSTNYQLRLTRARMSK